MHFILRQVTSDIGFWILSTFLSQFLTHLLNKHVNAHHTFVSIFDIIDDGAELIVKKCI